MQIKDKSQFPLFIMYLPPFWGGEWRGGGGRVIDKKGNQGYVVAEIDFSADQEMLQLNCLFE